MAVLIKNIEEENSAAVKGILKKASTKRKNYGNRY